MTLLSDLRVIWHLIASPIRGKSHAERLESFYSGQAGDYDAFRKRLLKGREEMYASIDAPEGGVWIDLGGGTGANVECIAPQLDKLSKVYVVDLSSSLLKVCRERAANRGWTNVEAVEADATQWRPAEGAAAVVTFSYSLTMIPDWFAAIDHALDLLKPGGTIGVVDFYVARKYPEAGHTQHGVTTRLGWPCWFHNDNVFISPDHVPYLHKRFDVVSYTEHRAKVPYIPLARVPYYRFIGRKR